MVVGKSNRSGDNCDQNEKAIGYDRKLHHIVFEFRIHGI